MAGVLGLHALTGLHPTTIRPMPTPYQKAFRRSYWRSWLSRAWRDAALWQRRNGLRANLAIALLTALAYWALVSRAVDIVPILLSAVGGVGLLFVGVLVFSLMTTPVTLALEVHMEQEGNNEPWWSVTVSPVEGGPLRMQFVTRNLAERYLPTETKTPLVALRFTNPVERIIKETDLPAEIKLPRRGKLVVKRFTHEGIVMGEVRTSGVMVEAELYERRQPHGP